MKIKTFLTGGLAMLLTFGGLAGCGDGVDQDNGISDGERKDEVDNNGPMEEAEDTLDDANDNLQDAKNDVEDALKEDGIGDGVDQDNGVSDSEKNDELDATNP